jgi:hypothetical protein
MYNDISLSKNCISLWAYKFKNNIQELGVTQQPYQADYVIIPVRTTEAECSIHENHTETLDNLTVAMKISTGNP